MKKTFPLVTIVILTALASCSSREYTVDEIRPVLDDLLTRAEEMNVIYFGTGIPPMEDAEEAEEFYAAFDYDIKSINYHPVSADAPYQTESELRAATLEVFTEGYSEYLFSRAFSGISETFVENGSDGEETARVESVVYAMYIETDGVLTVRLDLDDEAMELGREYDTSNMEILRSREDYVLVSVPSTMNGEPLDVELKLILTDDGWRLDSPTY